MQIDGNEELVEKMNRYASFIIRKNVCHKNGWYYSRLDIRKHYTENEVEIKIDKFFQVRIRPAPFQESIADVDDILKSGCKNDMTIEDIVIIRETSNKQKRELFNLMIDGKITVTHEGISYIGKYESSLHLTCYHPLKGEV